MRLKKTIGIALIVFSTLLSSCASIEAKRFLSSVDSLAKSDAAAKKRYVLMSGGKDIDEGDLQYQEFSGYVDKILADRGFEKTASFDEAEVAIFLSYAIGDPKTYQYSYSLPTWGQTGVSAAHTYGSVKTYGNTGTYSGTTTYTPTYGVTGSTTHIESNTVYTRFLFLDAYDIGIYSKENRMAQLWKTSVISTGGSGDLRLVVPYMVTAMKPYLGTNTGHKIEVEVAENDPAVLLLRSNQAPEIK